MRSIDPKRLVLGFAALGALLLVPGRGEAARTFDDKYAGSDTCQACHEDIYTNIVKSPHGVVDRGTPKGPKGDWKGHVCESCHGPGTQHTTTLDAKDISNPAKLTAARTDQVCLSCHLNQETHSGRLVSSHAKQGISCVSCHQVHANNGQTLAMRGPVAINQQCASCHLTVWASFQKPYGHRLTQNAMDCVDCHNPHGSQRRPMVQVAMPNEPSCFNCHSDKRGPFTFNHEPVRTEGCSACHEPHGSANPRMLTRHEVRLVCLECHSNLPAPNSPSGLAGIVPPALHDLRSPRYQNCTVCHQKIHGSYTDGYLIR